MSQIFTGGHALIIGVGGNLPNTVEDATRLADILKDPSRCAYPPEHVHLLTGKQATRSGILAQLDTLAQTTDAQSTVVVYFSGHGYQAISTMGESYYLLPYGYKVRRLYKTAITGSDFTAKLRAIPAQKVLLLLDCCHAGGVGEAKGGDLGMAKGPLPPEALALLNEGRGKVVIASSREDEESFAGHPVSAFTLAMIESLCGIGVAKKDGYVRVADIALHAREVVPKRTKDKQHPILHFEHADNFVLAYYAGGDMQPKGLPFASPPQIEPEPGAWTGHFESAVAIGGGDAVDLRGSQVAVYKPSGPVNQNFENIQVVLRDNNTVTLIFQDGKQLTIPFLAPPLPRYDLVGRDDLLRELKQQLSAGGNLALSALNGLPGVGKTALAVALSHDAELLAHFSDGVLWAGLGHNPDVLALLGTWATALGFTSDEIAKRTTIKERQELLKAAIGQKQMLLVADDAWQSEAGLAFQVGGPNCAHLLTTRQPSIALDFAGQSTTVTELSLVDGLLLLKKLAPAAVAAEPEAAEELVKAVDGLPLALILMGRYLQKESRDGQPSRLSTALKRLREVEERVYLEQAPAPPRYYPALPEGVPLSLWAAIVISDEALNDAASRTLYALSVFPPKPNTFSEDAAKAVSAEPVTTLYTLSDYGLLESGKPGRYTLHQTIADYARLERSDEAAEERMVNYFVEYVEAHERDYDVLEPETNNVGAALETASERGMQTALVHGTNAFGQFLNVRGLYGLAETLFLRAEQTARALNDATGLVTILPNLGRVAVKQGNYPQAKKYAEEGLVLARQLSNQDRICALLALRGGIALNCGEFGKAEGDWKEGLALARELKHHEQISNFLRNLSALAAHRGAYEQAEEYLQEGLKLARKIKNDELLSALLMSLGHVANNRGMYDQAEAYFQESLELARKIGHHERITELLLNLGVVAGYREAYDEAERYFQEGLKLVRELAQHEGISHMLLNLGYVAINREEYKQAEEYLEEGLALARKLGHVVLISGTLAGVGELYLQQDRRDLAVATFYELLEMAQKTGFREYAARALYGLAQVAVAHGNIAEARRQGQESLAIFEKIGHVNATEVREWLAALPSD